VALEVTPAPETVQRLWLYFVPSSTKVDLPTPRVSRVERVGFTVVELAYLTDREIPRATGLPESDSRARSLPCAVAGRRVGSRPQTR
jgi:hypothetical protein